MDYFTGSLFPSIVKDIEGKEINVQKLANQHHLILVTLKSTKCAVCPPMLKTINRYGLNNDVVNEKKNKELDPLILDPPCIDLTYYKLLLQKDAYFIILSPGPKSILKNIQIETKFEKFPFILDTDLAIADQLNMRLSSTMIWPAVLHIEPNLKLRPIHFGRAPGFYGVSILMNYLHGQREKVENQALDVLQESDLVLKRIKLKIAESNCNAEPSILSQDIWMAIFEKLSPIELASLAQTCKLFRYYAIVATYYKVCYLSSQVKKFSPKDDSGKVISHTLLNSMLESEELSYTNSSKFQRLELSIVHLRKATNQLREFITCYMTLGCKDLMN
ncbi:hypothetical protein K502DRAFT_362275 [Neoconidiobolus thromboides FSU 785]|nr:hypothetical protein K502DRAFT_362275 [Neoconidiobolus thromboides FSU 785]